MIQCRRKLGNPVKLTAEIFDPGHGRMSLDGAGSMDGMDGMERAFASLAFLSFLVLVAGVVALAML